jgi:hypothetical protein
MRDLTETKPFGMACTGLAALGTSYVAGASDWQLIAVTLVVIFAYHVSFSRELPVKKAAQLELPLVAWAATLGASDRRLSRFDKARLGHQPVVELVKTQNPG